MVTVFILAGHHCTISGRALLREYVCREYVLDDVGFCQAA